MKEEIKKDFLIEIIIDPNDIIYQTLLGDFNEDNFIKVGQYNCYSAELAYLLCFAEEVKNTETNQLFTLDRKAYRKTYYESYVKGIEYFEDTFKVSASSLYGDRSEFLIADIHHHYYHKEIISLRQGWNGIRGLSFRVLNHKTIRNIGYYSGILSRADELFNTYPNIFKTVHNCTKPSIEDNSRIENNIDFLKSTIQRFLEPLNKYFNNEDYQILLNELETYFDTGVFTNSNKIIKTINRPNKKLIGWTLKNIYNTCINSNAKLPIEYYRFGKDRISIFSDTSFDEKNYLKSNLYKYYHSKP